MNKAPHIFVLVVLSITQFAWAGDDIAPGTRQAQAQFPAVWTLAGSIRRALEIAPELRAAEAEIAGRAGELAQAEVWPNPSMDLNADDRLGQESGRGGVNLTSIALSQPLPLWRIARQRDVAEANVGGARENLRYQLLLLEHEVARVFHALQLAAAKRKLAEERLQLVIESPNASRKSGGDRLVRYLTPLERQRLSILNEEANQAVAVAEQEQQKALIAFRALLAVPDGARPETVMPTLPETPESMDVLMRALDDHPVLAAARKEIEAAQAGVALAESQRYADPVLNIFRERSYISGELRDVTGVGVSVQIPFRSSSNGTVVKAMADAERTQAQLDVLKRDARSRLEQAYTQLLRLVEQTERLRTNLLEPVREMFTLTRSGFAVGELNILALIDANNTYFDARTRYLEMQMESALAAADLRLASGISVLNPSMEVQP
ncbi:MAG: TolC family protein [Nitrosomonadales bacterium]|nr:TolC family protein [Nitrosomonadales bacterium]